jgi:hypothetical protein
MEKEYRDGLENARNAAVEAHMGAANAVLMEEDSWDSRGSQVIIFQIIIFRFLNAVLCR